MASVLTAMGRVRFLYVACLTLSIVLMADCRVLAQDNTQPAAEASEQAPPVTEPTAPAEKPPMRNGPTDRAELEAFIDGIMAAHLKDKHIAGATIAVVVDNKPFFAKGYGLADVEANTPVDPDLTMFRIGSVSKLFTWTAVMQLVEQGKLDLDADVNQYLTEFKIPQTFPKPITLKDLLTHTPGFEDHAIGLFAHGAENVTPLGPLLARELPTRVRPPGEAASYSNHGTALAGYIVSQVAGMPWEDYIERNILQPLNMNHTTVRQPAQDKLSPEMSKGYKREAGRYKEQGFEYVPIAPAGSMSASASDMAKFMIAHLQNGVVGDARILQEETARRMRELLFTHDPRVSGMAYGFMRMKYNDLEIVEHGGDTFWFHTELAIIPQKKAGLFVSYNTDTVGRSREQLLEAFLDRYYPVSASPPKKPPEDFHDRADRYAGTYEMNRYSHTTPAKLGALLSAFEVSVDGDVLQFAGLGQPPKRFVEVEPLLFQEIDGHEMLAFREDDHGQITQLFADGIPPIAFDRLPWYRQPVFMIGLFIGCVAILLSALVGWPFVAFVRWGWRRTDDWQTTTGSRVASWLAWLSCLAILVWLSVFAIPLADEGRELAYGMPPVLEGLLKVSPLIPALVAVILLCTLVVWAKGYWRFSGRLHYTFVLVAGIALVWFLSHWNLMRFGA